MSASPDRAAHFSRTSIVNGHRIIGPIFFEETINSEWYINLILDPFFDELTYQECMSVFSQQDFATAHTADRSMRELRRIFGRRIISKELWPPRSPELTPCDFYL